MRNKKKSKKQNEKKHGSMFAIHNRKREEWKRKYGTIVLSTPDKKKD
jgi:hypothetical protein